MAHEVWYNSLVAIRYIPLYNSCQYPYEFAASPRIYMDIVTRLPVEYIVHTYSHFVAQYLGRRWCEFNLFLLLCNIYFILVFLLLHSTWAVDASVRASVRNWTTGSKAANSTGRWSTTNVSRNVHPDTWRTRRIRTTASPATDPVLKVGIVSQCLQNVLYYSMEDQASPATDPVRKVRNHISMLAKRLIL